ncbi:hypothetical protein DIPPA_59580 [Diplonema papillatum]|nr:hypothetical protein DIPPA_59580 [Diplonema papillatum]
MSDAGQNESPVQQASKVPTENRSRQGSVSSQKAPGTPAAKMSEAGAGANLASPPRSHGQSVASMSKHGSQRSLTAQDVTQASSAVDEQVPTLEVNEPSVQGGMSRKGSQLSAVGTAMPRAPSQMSVHSGMREPGRGGGSNAGDIPDGASVHSETQAMGVPLRTETPDHEDLHEELPEYAEDELDSCRRELAAANSRIVSLEKDKEALQRLMSSSSGDAKVRILTQDLQKRSEKIKQLEAELKRQMKRVDDAERQMKTGRHKDRRHSRASIHDKSSAQDRAVIKELQQKLVHAEARLKGGHHHVDASSAHSFGEEPRHPNSRDSQSQATILKLRSLLAERETEVARLRQRLDRAQEAIVSSAGAGFENEVKLQQARSALKCILSSQSPSSRARSPSPASLAHSQPGSPYASQFYGSAGFGSPEHFSPLATFSATSQPRTVSPSRQRLGSPYY